MTENADGKGKITKVRRVDVPHTYGQIVPGTYEGSELFFRAVEIMNSGYEMLQRVKGKQGEQPELDDNPPRGTPGANTVNKYPKWFPKRESKRREWGRVLAAFKELEESFHDGFYEDFDRDRPKPETDDYRGAALEILGKRPSGRWTRNVKRAGRNGWLDDYMP